MIFHTYVLSLYLLYLSWYQKKCVLFLLIHVYIVAYTFPLNVLCVIYIYDGRPHVTDKTLAVIGKIRKCVISIYDPWHTAVPDVLFKISGSLLKFVFQLSISYPSFVEFWFWSLMNQFPLKSSLTSYTWNKMPHCPALICLML